MKITDPKEAAQPRRKSKSNKPSWPPIHELQYDSGKRAYQVCCMVGGKRIREAYPTKGEAEDRAAQIRNQIENEGTAGFSVPLAERVEAARCIELLKPFEGETITKAVEHYLEHVLKFKTAPTVAEIVKKLLADSERNQRRARTTKDIKDRLGVFARTFGERRISEITRDELKEWLDDPTLGARSRINYSVKASQLYNYAIANGWTEHNVAATLPRPDAEDSEPGIVTPEQAARLLEHAGELLPYVAIGLFAGLRSAELLRLDWQNVKLSERSIIIGAKVAKKRSRRVVEINDTLAAWLPSCAKSRGPVVECEANRLLYEKLKTLATAAGLESWPHNGLRHSCASYSLADSGDAVRVAYSLGNSADMIHRHYKALVTKADADRFWKLRPSEGAGKIVPMVKAA